MPNAMSICYYNPQPHAATPSLSTSSSYPIPPRVTLPQLPSPLHNTATTTTSKQQHHTTRTRSSNNSVTSIPQPNTNTMGKETQAQTGFKLVGFKNFVRTNPKSDRFQVNRFHHIEFWCTDATNAACRFSWGLGMPIVAKSDLSTGNQIHASYLLRSGDLSFLFSAPYSPSISAASGAAATASIPTVDAAACLAFAAKHGLGVRAIAVEVADAETAFNTSSRARRSPGVAAGAPRRPHRLRRGAPLRRRGPPLHQLRGRVARGGCEPRTVVPAGIRSRGGVPGAGLRDPAAGPRRRERAGAGAGGELPERLHRISRVRGVHRGGRGNE
ncbi:4-hydroxyphenylpyruvate dioxygenase [Spatholobus suberectus]|nr:4-hydroxyphenylpyruvate dioxygenase [Spatholobus suberectus]